MFACCSTPTHRPPPVIETGEETATSDDSVKDICQVPCLFLSWTAQPRRHWKLIPVVFFCAAQCLPETMMTIIIHVVAKVLCCGRHVISLLSSWWASRDRGTIDWLSLMATNQRQQMIWIIANRLANQCTVIYCTPPQIHTRAIRGAISTDRTHIRWCEMRNISFGLFLFEYYADSTLLLPWLVLCKLW